MYCGSAAVATARKRAGAAFSQSGVLRCRPRGKGLILAQLSFMILNGPNNMGLKGGVAHEQCCPQGSGAALTLRERCFCCPS